MRVFFCCFDSNNPNEEQEQVSVEIAERQKANFQAANETKQIINAVVEQENAASGWKKCSMNAAVRQERRKIGSCSKKAQQIA